MKEQFNKIINDWKVLIFVQNAVWLYILPEANCWKDLLKKLSKFTRNTCARISFLNKVAGNIHREYTFLSFSFAFSFVWNLVLYFSI